MVMMKQWCLKYTQAIYFCRKMKRRKPKKLYLTVANYRGQADTLGFVKKICYKNESLNSV